MMTANHVLGAPRIKIECLTRWVQARSVDVTPHWTTDPVALAFCH